MVLQVIFYRLFLAVKGFQIETFYSNCHGLGVFIHVFICFVHILIHLSFQTITLSLVLHLILPSCSPVPCFLSSSPPYIPDHFLQFLYLPDLILDPGFAQPVSYSVCLEYVCFEYLERSKDSVACTHLSPEWSCLVPCCLER